MQKKYAVAEARDCDGCKDYLQNLPDIMTAHLSDDQLQAIYAELCQNCHLR